MPFEKGKSGNPGGRPKAEGEIRELARQHGPDAIDKLVEHMNSEDTRLSQSAAIALLDRGFGKPPQALNLGGQEDNPLIVESTRPRLTQEQWEDKLKIVK